MFSEKVPQFGVVDVALAESLRGRHRSGLEERQVIVPSSHKM